MRAVAAVALVVGMVACQQGDPAPTPSPTETPAVARTTETSVPHPEEESPEDFIRRWQAAADVAQSTGDSREFRRLSAKGCSPCRRFVDSVGEAWEGGGRVEFAGTEIVRFVEAPYGRDTYDYDFRIPEARVYSGSGELVRTVPGGESLMYVTLEPSGKSWKVLVFGGRAK